MEELLIPEFKLGDIGLATDSEHNWKSTIGAS